VGYWLKSFVAFGATAALIAACSTDQARHAPTDGRLGTNQPSLFLHLIIPTLYLEKTQPPKRIVTTQVHLSKTFAVIVGEDLETLSGIVEARGGRFHASLRANCMGTGNFVTGEFEAEKLVTFPDLAFSGYIVMGNFVLSTNSDCKPFLERLAVHDQANPRHFENPAK
jgi:hypothetical protein